ncbi:hypothetical protein ACLOJK_014835 [Asimina triloba]
MDTEMHFPCCPRLKVAYCFEFVTTDGWIAIRVGLEYALMLLMGCYWIEQGMMKMGAMVDAARETLPKGFDAGDAAGCSPGDGDLGLDVSHADLLKLGSD